jgi:hypothetical protein
MLPIRFLVSEMVRTRQYVLWGSGTVGGGAPPISGQMIRWRLNDSALQRGGAGKLSVVTCLTHPGRRKQMILPVVNHLGNSDITAGFFHIIQLIVKGPKR